MVPVKMSGGENIVNEETIEMALNDFGAYVRKTRQHFGMSLQELADKTNLSPAFINRIEVGKRKARINTRLVILLCGFNWDIDEIMAYFEGVLKNIKEFKKVIN